MSSELQYHFDDFHLDVANRQLRRDGVQIALKARYFDALVLLVREHGQLVEKDKFFSDVWGDVVVSDAALTQCIKDIRKQLGDDASNPRYIRTVTGHGYRFIGHVEINPVDELVQNGEAASPTIYSPVTFETSNEQFRRILITGGGGTVGGIVAGLTGGLLYGFALAFSGEAGMGAISMVLVIISLCVVISGMGGLGVSFGMATAKVLSDDNKVWTVTGAALGGLLIGGLVKLLGVDAFNLLFGKAPEGITGGLEGAVLGAAVALGAVAGGGCDNSRRLRPALSSAIAAAVMGTLISVSGGRLMTGSLNLLARSFPNSKLHLEALGGYFGEMNFGFITQAVLAGFEGFLFGACVVGGIVYSGRFYNSI